MPLGCGPNRKKLKANGSGSHAIHGAAHGVAMGTFAADIAAKLPAFTNWSNQVCPGQCPIKGTIDGANFTITNTWNANTNQWDVEVKLLVDRLITCAVAGPGGGGGGGKKGGKGKKGRRTARGK